MGGVEGVQIWVRQDANESVKHAARTLLKELTKYGTAAELKETPGPLTHPDEITINVGSKHG